MYTLIINKVLQYKLVLDNFTKTQSLSFRTNDTFRIIVQGLIARLRISIQIRLNNKMRILSSKMRQKTSIFIKFRMISVTFVTKFRTKLSQIFRINIINTFIAKLKQKVSTIIFIPSKIIYSPLLGKFFPLSLYDPQTLGALDIKTLADIDYQVY